MSKSGLKNIRLTPAGHYEVIISSRSYGTFHNKDKAIAVRDKAEHDRIEMKQDLSFKRKLVRIEYKAYSYGQGLPPAKY